jgi:hypothetical protein
VKEKCSPSPRKVRAFCERHTGEDVPADLIAADVGTCLLASVHKS